MSTRKVDALVQALGLSSGVDKSAVSRLCRELDEVDVVAQAQFRQRPLESASPYLWLDALYLKVRPARPQSPHRQPSGGDCRGRARDGRTRRALASRSGPARRKRAGVTSCAACAGRGLHGVQFVVSDAHEGLKAAIAGTLQAASWQRCRVHTIRTQSIQRRVCA